MTNNISKNEKNITKDLLNLLIIFSLILTLSLSMFKNFQKDNEILELKTIIKEQQETIIDYRYDE